MALGSAGLAGTGASMDNYVPTVWSKRIQSAFEASLKGKGFALDLTSVLNDVGGDVINVPKLANRTATTRSIGAFSQITPVGATEDVFTMNVQTWNIDPEFVSDALPAQTKIWAYSQLDHKMRESVERLFDTTLLANYSSFTATALGTLGSAPTPDNFFDAIQTLNSNNVPMNDIVILLGPKTFWDLVKNDVLPSGDYTSNMAKESGRIPMIGGVPVVMSTNIPTSSSSEVNLVMAKEALAFAIAKPLYVDREHKVDYQGDVVVSGMIYGTGCYRPEAGVAVYGR